MSDDKTQTTRKYKQASLTGLEMVQAENKWALACLWREKGIIVDGAINPEIRKPYKTFYNVKTDRTIVRQRQ